MNVQILFVFLMLVSMAHGLCAQTVSNVNFDEISRITHDAASQNHYPALLQRFLKLDPSLTAEEYKLIYYGNVFYSKYNPYGHSASENTFTELYNKRQFKEAIPAGEETLRENPVNVGVLFKMLICHDQTGDIERAKAYARSYYSLLGAIRRSGDGLSLKTAFVVIKISDEYELLAELKLHVKKQELIDQTDRIVLDTSKQDGRQAISEIYFNVSKPMDHLHQMFK